MPHLDLKKSGKFSFKTVFTKSNESISTHVHCTGFVQSLEFLKKSGNLRTTFPDLEKVWKLKAKS